MSSTVVTGLHRRGITTQVEKRLEWEAWEIAQERLQLAAEHGHLAKEQQAIETSIIELSTDVTAAEHWIEYRERQKEIENDPAKAKDGAAVTTIFRCNPTS